MVDKATAVTSELKAEIASARRDPALMAYNNILLSQDDTLRRRAGSKGVRLYREALYDPHAYAVLQKRKLALISREWEVEPASDDKADIKAADFVRETLDALPFDRICEDLLAGLLFGYAVCEVIWIVRDGRVIPSEIKSRAPERFVFDLDGVPRLLILDNMIEGVPLPERKFITHSFGDSQSPYGLGLGSRLFWLVWFKRQLQAQWLVFCEKHASPTAVGKYAPGTSQPDQAKLLDAIVGIAQASGITVPMGSEIGLIETARSGAEYEKALRYFDEQISECVLGETLTTNLHGGGSLAAAEVHSDVKDELVDADGDLLSATLNATLLTWLTEFNHPSARPPRIWRQRPANDLEIETLRKTRAEVAVTLKKAGYRLKDEKAASDFFEIEVVSDADEPAVDDEPKPAPAFAEPRDHTEPESEFADQLEVLTASATDALLRRIKRLLDTAESWAEVQDGLLALYAAAPTDELAFVLERAMAAAELQGMADAKADGAVARPDRGR